MNVPRSLSQRSRGVDFYANGCEEKVPERRNYNSCKARLRLVQISQSAEKGGRGVDRTARKFVQVLGLGTTIDERSGGRRRAASVDEELNGCRGFNGATALLVLSAGRRSGRL